jgi:hypothetical protein
VTNGWLKTRHANHSSVFRPEVSLTSCRGHVTDVPGGMRHANRLPVCRFAVSRTNCPEHGTDVLPVMSCSKRKRHVNLREPLSAASQASCPEDVTIGLMNTRRRANCPLAACRFAACGLTRRNRPPVCLWIRKLLPQICHAKRKRRVDLLKSRAAVLQANCPADGPDDQLSARFANLSPVCCPGGMRRPPACRPKETHCVNLRDATANCRVGVVDRPNYSLKTRCVTRPTVLPDGYSAAFPQNLSVRAHCALLRAPFSRPGHPALFLPKARHRADGRNVRPT